MISPAVAGVVISLAFSLSACGQRTGGGTWVTTWMAPVRLSISAPAGFGSGARRPGGAVMQTPARPPAQGNTTDTAPGTASARSDSRVAATATENSTNPAPANAPRRGLTLDKFEDQTVRMIVRVSLGGHRFRLRFTNAFGAEPLTIDAVRAGLQDHDAEVKAGTDRQVLFNGKPKVVIGPGVEVLSDPFDFEAPGLSHLAISVYVADYESTPTTHPASLYTVSYVPRQKGDLTATTSLPEADASNAFYWLSGIDVLGPPSAGTVIAFGDSITDAVGAQGPDQGWPSQLAERLQANKGTRSLAVADAGISGNRLLSDGAGVSGLARLDRQALTEPGARWVVLLEGINDIGFSALSNSGLTSAEVIGAYRQVIAKAHSLGLRVAGCTLLPDKGAFYYRTEKTNLRQEVNAWIRTSGAFDAVIDFDATMRDKDDPEQIRLDLQRGDHLHPNAAGYKAMSDAIDLSLFTAKPVPTTE